MFHLGSLTLQPAGLLDSLSEPLSGNLLLQVTLNTSPKPRGPTTEFPRIDFNQQVICFTRQTRQISAVQKDAAVRNTGRNINNAKTNKGTHAAPVSLPHGLFFVCHVDQRKEIPSYLLRFKKSLGFPAPRGGPTNPSSSRSSITLAARL